VLSRALVALVTFALVLLSTTVAAAEFDPKAPPHSPTNPSHVVVVAADVGRTRAYVYEWSTKVNAKDVDANARTFADTLPNVYPMLSAPRQFPMCKVPIPPLDDGKGDDKGTDDTMASSASASPSVAADNSRRLRRLLGVSASVPVSVSSSPSVGDEQKTEPPVKHYTKSRYWRPRYTITKGIDADLSTGR
jgi:hypothetical protein